MKKYKVLFTEKANKDLEKIKIQDKTKIILTASKLKDFPIVQNIKKLKDDKKNRWRQRIDTWRILFRPDKLDNEDIILVLRIILRKEAYREL